MSNMSATDERMAFEAFPALVEKVRQMAAMNRDEFVQVPGEMVFKMKAQRSVMDAVNQFALKHLVLIAKEAEKNATVRIKHPRSGSFFVPVEFYMNEAKLMKERARTFQTFVARSMHAGPAGLTDDQRTTKNEFLIVFKVCAQYFQLLESRFSAIWIDTDDDISNESSGPEHDKAVFEQWERVGEFFTKRSLESQFLVEALFDKAIAECAQVGNVARDPERLKRLLHQFMVQGSRITGMVSLFCHQFHDIPELLALTYVRAWRLVKESDVEEVARKTKAGKKQDEDEAILTTMQQKVAEMLKEEEEQEKKKAARQDALRKKALAEASAIARRDKEEKAARQEVVKKVALEVARKMMCDAVKMREDALKLLNMHSAEIQSGCQNDAEMLVHRQGISVALDMLDTCKKMIAEATDDLDVFFTQRSGVTITDGDIDEDSEDEDSMPSLVPDPTEDREVPDAGSARACKIISETLGIPRSVDEWDMLYSPRTKTTARVTIGDTLPMETLY